MEPGKQGTPGAIVMDVVHLCDRYQALNKRCAELDQQIMALTKGDQERDVLWLELDGVLTGANTLITQLVAAPANDQAGLRAKAVVLADLLRRSETEAAYSDQETAELALSITDDLARLA